MYNGFMTMKYRQLGPKGPKVSALGFGCMRFPTEGGKIDRRQSTAMLYHAIDSGVNYLDTAYPYHGGESETLIADVVTGRRREQVMIADKMPVWLVESASDLDKYFDEQRRRLKSDTIDVYHLHALNGERWEKMKKFGASDWLARKKEAGDIRYAGFSFHDDYAAFEYIVNGWNWDVCQIQYNFMDINEQAGTKGLCLAHSKGVGVIVMEPLLGGNLATPPRTVQAIWDRSATPDRSPVERALRWVWDQKEVGLVLSGMSAMEHVEENLQVASEAAIGELDAAELALYDKVRVAYISLKAIGCTACEYCMPCPEGVDIPSNFRAYNQAATYGNLEGARGQYARMKDLFDRGLSETDTRGIHCISCGTCEPKCPQGLKIGDLMPEVAAVLDGTKTLEEASIS
jgi:predicted aldo/keto reductase-like oxidoreductase